MRAKTVVIAAATVAPVVAQLFGATFTGPLWDKYGGVTVSSTTQVAMSPTGIGASCVADSII